MRGSIWLGQLRYMQDTMGTAPLTQALAASTATTRTALARVLPVSWVCTEAAAEFKQHVAWRVGEDCDALQRRVCCGGIEYTARGVWRPMLKFVPDRMLASRIPTLYRRAFDKGGLEVETLGTGAVLVRVLGWPDMTHFDAMGIASGLEAVLSIAGRTDVSCRFGHGSDDAHVYFELRWRAD